jgi:hypothetical protein
MDELTMLKESAFFFEKKNQKTFALAVVELPLTAWPKRRHSTRNKSLFASFSSEKEESCCFSPPPRAGRGRSWRS